MSATTGTNVLMSALLSLTLTVMFAVLYVFYPLILALFSTFLNSSGSGRVVIVAGGVSRWFFKILFPLALILFLIIFGLLQRKRIKS